MVTTKYSPTVFTPFVPFPSPIISLVSPFEDVHRSHQRERTLRESEERFRLLIEGVQEYAISSWIPRAHSQLNAGAQRLKGYDSAEIIGHHFFHLLSGRRLMNDKPRDILARAARERTGARRGLGVSARMLPLLGQRGRHLPPRLARILLGSQN